MLNVGMNNRRTRKRFQENEIIIPLVPPPFKLNWFNQRRTERTGRLPPTPRKLIQHLDPHPNNHLASSFFSESSRSMHSHLLLSNVYLLHHKPNCQLIKKLLRPAGRICPRVVGYKHAFRKQTGKFLRFPPTHKQMHNHFSSSIGSYISVYRQITGLLE